MNVIKFLTEIHLEVVSPWPGGIYLEAFQVGEVLKGKIHNPHAGLVDVEVEDGRIILSIPENELEYQKTNIVTV